MYNIAKDSIFQPRALIKYRNKSGWFAFFYLLFLTLIMTIDSIVFYAGYPYNDVITSETTGCEIVDGNLACDPLLHDDTDKYQLYGYSIFFLDETTAVATINSLMDESTIIVQNDSLDFYVNGEKFTSIGILADGDETDFDAFFATMKTAILIGSLFIGFFGNLLLLLFISLVSTIPFIRLRKYVKYGKMYKLVIFAITPIAFLMTFYYLLNLPEILFFILMFVGYRSVYLLQREMYFQTMLHIESQNPSVVDADYEIHDPDKEEPGNEDSHDDESDD